MNKSKETMCCLCGFPFPGYGHNPAPLKGDRCCDDCNTLEVIPARMRAWQVQFAKAKEPEASIAEAI